MRWNYLKLFIKWIKTHKIRTKIADKRIGYEILWEFGRELKAPTYQNAVMTHLCEDDDFFQRILAKDILRLYKRVSKDGVDIHEHMFLRFCLDVVIFPGNRSLFRKIVVLGGPLAVLVAEEAIDYAHCLAADPSDLPLGGRLDPTHNNQLHHYLLDKNLNIGDAFLQDPENLGVSMSGGNGDTGVQPEDGNDVQRIDAKEEEESLLDDERSIEMSEAGLEALYNGVKKRD